MAENEGTGRDKKRVMQNPKKVMRNPVKTDFEPASRFTGGSINDKDFAGLADGAPKPRHQDTTGPLSGVTPPQKKKSGWRKKALAVLLTGTVLVTGWNVLNNDNLNDNVRPDHPYAYNIGDLNEGCDVNYMSLGERLGIDDNRLYKDIFGDRLPSDGIYNHVLKMNERAPNMGFFLYEMAHREHFKLCADDLPGTYKGVYLDEGNRIVLDMTPEPGAHPEVTVAQMIVHAHQAERGVMEYSTDWDLEARRTHVISYEATAVVTSMALAYEMGQHGDGTLWQSLLDNPETAELAQKFHENYEATSDRQSEQHRLFEAAYLTWGDAFDTPDFVDANSEKAMGVYFAQVMNGEMDGYGKFMKLDDEFRTQMLRAGDIGHIWDHVQSTTVNNNTPYAYDASDYSGNRQLDRERPFVINVAGERPLQAAGLDSELSLDLQWIAQAIERERILQAEDGEITGSYERFPMDKDNPYRDVDMQQVFETFKAGNYEGSIVEVFHDALDSTPSPSSTLHRAHGPGA